MKQWGGDLNYRPEKTFSEKKELKKRKAKDTSRVARVEVAPKNDNSSEQKIQSERDYRVGKTIAGATNHARQRNLEHIAARKRQQRKNFFVAIGSLVIVAIVVLTIVNYVDAKIKEHESEVAAANPVEPTVTIVDENVGSNVSSRVKTFVARLEADASDYQQKVDHVVLPFQKAREILVYFVGRNEYYRMTTERGSTVQMEDAERMMRYLDGKELSPEYVDLRIEGKAYYK